MFLIQDILKSILFLLRFWKNRWKYKLEIYRRVGLL